MIEYRGFLRDLALVAVLLVIDYPGSLAGAESPDQKPALGRPQIALDIEHTTTTTPIPGTRIFAMPHPGLRTDTRTAMNCTASPGLTTLPLSGTGRRGNWRSGGRRTGWPAMAPGAGRAGHRTPPGGVSFA